jgi:hypothetical protein
MMTDRSDHSRMFGDNYFSGGQEATAVAVGAPESLASAGS